MPTLRSTPRSPRSRRPRALGRAALLATIVTATSFGFAACSGGSPEVTTQVTGLGSGARGVLLAAEGAPGVFDVRVIGAPTSRAVRLRDTSNVIPLRGNVAILGLRADLAGAYDPATGQIRLSGSTSLGGITVEATFHDGRVTGTWRLDSGLSGTLAGLGIGAEPVALYCGATAGRTGSIGVASSGSLAGAVVSFEGSALRAFIGTRSGDAISLRSDPDGRVSGTVAAESVSGTVDDGAGRATFAASSAACPDLGGAVRGDGGSDASVDVDAGDDDASLGDASLSDASLGDASLSDVFAPDSGIELDAAVDSGTDAGPGSPILGTVNGVHAQMVVTKDHVLLTSAALTNVVIVRKDGTSVQRTAADTCSIVCAGLIGAGDDAFVWEEQGQTYRLKRITPSTAAVSSTLVTLPAKPVAARSLGNYLYVSTGPTFYKYDRSGTLVATLSDPQNETTFANAFDVTGSDSPVIHYSTPYSLAVSADQDPVVRRMNDVSVASSMKMAHLSEVGDYRVSGAIVADGNQSFFFAAKYPNTRDVRVFVVGATARSVETLATIPVAGGYTPNWSIPFAAHEAYLDATHLYFWHVASTPEAPTEYTGRLVRLGRSTRNALAPDGELRRFPPRTAIVAIGGDASNVYVAYAAQVNGNYVTTVERIPKP